MCLYTYHIYTRTVGTPGRDEKFATRVTEFEDASVRLAETAHDFAKSGGVMDKKTANDIISTSGKVRRERGWAGGRRREREGGGQKREDKKEEREIRLLFHRLNL